MDVTAADGVVFKSPEAIHQVAVDYFSNFLQIDLARNYPDLFYLISHVISEEENARIGCILSMDEVF